MPLIFLDAAEPTALNNILFGTFAGAVLHLYKNNYTPVDTSVLANFTEADFSGYAALTTAMGAAVETAGKAVSNDTMARVFAHNGGGTANTIYGYFVTNGIGTVVAWAERFSAPISMAAVPDKITITAQLTLDSENH